MMLNLGKIHHYSEAMDRRDFFGPENLGRSASQVLAAMQALDDPPLPDSQSGCSFLRFSHQAMATDWEFIVPFGTPGAMDAADVVFDRIDRLEEQLTVYRTHSEVSQLNQTAWQRPVAVDPELFDLLALASRLNQETEGAFDITAGALIKAWGFFRGPRRVPEQSERAQALSRVGMKHARLDAEAKTVRFLREGLEINLGAIGKGYALDRAVADLRARGNVSSALLHGGHSSVYAIGSEPGTERGWLVALGHPLEPGRSLGTLRLRNLAMGTSAATFQYLEHRGRKLGHILDPRIGWPATGVLSATVVANSAAQADALATAFFILGPKKADAYCRSHEDVGVILVVDGASRPNVLGRLGGVFRAAEESVPLPG
ncbi:MAG TPA: FAD:protein FMN transferase [Gemmataceae bacterium]|jgi:thiamine biosynthesis lipoprotein|nr:FAD:protein FMN transferase [Gemmataceae bacterium]